MKRIKRGMTVDEAVEDNGFRECQASFNSDGNITLRNYNGFNKNYDEIIILSNTETEALFKLFSKIGQKIKNYDLPF
jgi:hypothetical protein